MERYSSGIYGVWMLSAQVAAGRSAQRHLRLQPAGGQTAAANTEQPQTSALVCQGRVRQGSGAVGCV